MVEKSVKRLSRSAGIIIIVSFACAFFLAPLAAPIVVHSPLRSFLITTSKVVAAIPAFGGRAAGHLAEDQQILDGVRIWLLVLSLCLGFGFRRIVHSLGHIRRQGSKGANCGEG